MTSKTTTDTGALKERIARALTGHHFVEYSPGCGSHVDLGPQEAAHLAAAILPIVAAGVCKAKAEVLTKRWVCHVARSGYHNGASCRPGDAHNGWGCDYYYEASIRATEYETADRA